MFNRGWGKKALGYQLIGYYLRKYPDKKIGIITKTKFAQLIKYLNARYLVVSYIIHMNQRVIRQETKCHYELN